jgi:hypothetical protein
MSFHEDTLGDSRVLNSWLNNVNGVVIKVVIDDTLSQSIVLICVFNDWFLEISIKGEALRELK